MEYLEFLVTRNGVKPINKKDRSNKSYETKYYPKISTKFYSCSELLPLYVTNAVIYVSAFN